MINLRRFITCFWLNEVNADSSQLVPKSTECGGAQTSRPLDFTLGLTIQFTFEWDPNLSVKRGFSEVNADVSGSKVGPRNLKIIENIQYL